MRLSTMRYTRNGGSLLARALKQPPRESLASSWLALNDTTLSTRRLYAKALYVADAASQDDVTKATNILADVARAAHRRASCIWTERIDETLDRACAKLIAMQTKRRRSTRTQAALEAAVLAM